ncbi:TlpA disulfide reductase family protein [Opitutus sp. GAS368]|uniref:TlpA disulfide reductase family protein n=1 Tax=Opitutus sp. GAS368 TaxID=1882749 RepID=UPI00087AAA9E|nr:TlpA disulfide reductase family protein [Opitutus sp. GAS368]SDS04894.1 Peroxiredoxin [Opitutus sp. GAS368]
MTTARLLTVFLALALAAFAQTGSDADALFGQLQEQVQQRPPEGTPQEKRHAWYDVSYDRASRLAGAFADKYPSDPRVWEALGYVVQFKRQTANPAEAAAFVRQQQEVRTRILTSPGVPEKVLAQAYIAEMKPLLEREPAAPADLARAGELLAQFRQRAPQSGSRAYAETQYLRALEHADEAAAEAYARKLSADPNAPVAELAKKTAAAIAFRREPVSLKHTAFDGREVDFTKLRGKVVLIDFWATWCGPCMEQMPEIKRVYRQYHDLGLEIVGVADEIVPRDPAKPRGVEKTPAMLQAFLDQQEMPWPQLWDQRPVSERHGVNEFAALFGVGSLPTTFLLDRNGRIYSTDNHGEKLEQNVRQLLALPTATSDSPVAAPQGNADKDYARLMVLRSARVPEGLGKEERTVADRQNRDRTGRAAEKFAVDYPDDPRHWEAVASAVDSPRVFAGPDAQAEKDGWAKRRVELREQLLAAPGVNDQVWLHVAEFKVYDETGWYDRPAGDLAVAERTLDQIAVRLPGSDRRKFAEQQFYGVKAKADPAAAEARLRRLVATEDRNPALKQMAAGLLAVIEAKRTPLELKFTAADGREVDLARLRGKVVLVDFWATWCAPCMEEMPNVKRVYEKYHDQGFEIIGISFDKAPGATPRAMEKTAAQVCDFAAAHGMPWPQGYDGRYWETAVGHRFAINSIPAAFLLGKDGRLVTTDNHGEKLEPHVREALGLTP